MILNFNLRSAMASKACVYNKNHSVPIHYDNNNVEDRTINITISTFNDIVEIKVRDPTEFSFNYTERIDANGFDIMKDSQSLDIDFSEFKYNVLDMLQQYQKKEMFLKCVVSGDICTLVFYGKSKIKSIVYLTVDLHTTNQKEIFQELIGTLNNFHDLNEKLKKQASNLKNVILDKEQQIQHMNYAITQLDKHFYTNIRKVEEVVNAKFEEMLKRVLNKIGALNKRVGNLQPQVENMKKETFLKAESSNRLIRTMENLRIENADNTAVVNQLRHENAQLKNSKCSLEKTREELRHLLDQERVAKGELQKKNDELRGDLEKASTAIMQKKASIDELTKDLVQANQLLVNFNRHYDALAKQTQAIQKKLDETEKVTNDQRLAYNELTNSYQQYKMRYNEENEEKLKREISSANIKIDDLEKALRKTNKINTLLTEKVNQNNQLH